MFELPKPFSDIRVLGLMADQAACGYYRLEFPFEFLRQGGAKADTTGVADLGLMKDYDVIVVQRNYDPHLFSMLMEAKRFGKVVIYEMDDNLHSVHPYSPAFKVFRPGSQNLHWVNQYLKSFDGLFTSTQDLASVYGPVAKRSWVIPNTLDFGIRDWETPAPRDSRLVGRTVIGWAGSSFHPDDMLPLGSSLKQVLQKNPRAVFAICSGPDQVRQFLQPLGLPPEQVVVLSPTHFWDYPQLLTQFDIGLAPISNSLFNRGKSCLKLLEYGAWGIPYVASKVAPYHRFHQDSQGQFGHLGEGSGSLGWAGSLQQMLDYWPEWQEQGDILRSYVRKNFNTQTSAYLWAAALRQARDFARYQPESRIQQQAVATRKPGRNDVCPCNSGHKYKHCCSPAFG